jgi:hypothetical protein
MADKIIIEYDVNVSKLEAGLNRVEKDLKDVEKASEKQTQKQTQNTKKQADNLKKVNKETSTLKDNFNKLANNLPFSGALMQAQQLGESFLGLGKSVGGASSMFGKLKVAIASTGIGLLVVALASLFSWFKRTDDGATFLDGAMRGLTVTFNKILDPLADFGEWLVNSLTSVEGFKNGISDLGDFIQNQFQTRIEGFVKIGESFVNIFKARSVDDFKSGLKDLANAGLQTTLGIENAIDKTIELGQEIIDLNRRAQSLAVALDANADKQAYFAVKATEAQIAIDKLFLQGRNRGIEAQKRQDIFLTALEKEKELTEENIKLKEEQLQLTLQDVVFNAKKLDSALEGEKAQIELSKNLRAFELAANGDLEKGVKKRFELRDEERTKYQAIIKEINAIRIQEVKFQEKVINQVAALNDQQITETLEQQQIFSEELLFIQEKRLIDGVTNEKQAQKDLIQARIDGANKALQEFEKIENEQKKSAKNLLNEKLIDEKQYQSLLFGINQNFDKLRTQQRKIIFDNEVNQLKIKLAEEEAAYQESNKIYQDYSKDLILQIKEEEQTRIESSKGTEAEIKEIKLDTQRSILQSEIDSLSTLKDLAEEAGKDTIDIERSIREKQLELRKTYNEKEVDEEKKKQDELKKVAKEKGIEIAEETIMQLAQQNIETKRQEFDAIQKSEEEFYTRQSENLKKARTNNLLTEDQFKQREAQLETQKTQKDKELTIRKFNFEKQLKLKQLALETALGVAKAIATKGFPLGLVEAGFITLQSGIQAGIIQSQKPPKFEKGGIIGGKPHSQGGTLIEAEKGEFIINKKATEKYRPLLEELNTNGIRNKSNLLPLMKRAENNKNAKKQLERTMMLNAIKSSTDLSHLERLTKANKKVNVANTGELAQQIAKRMNNNTNYIK